MQSQGNNSSLLGIRVSRLILLLALITIGISSRFLLSDYPNFKPVAAIALFCGFYFQRRWIAVGAAAAILLVSDLALGFYQWQVMTGVYGSILIACLLGHVMRTRINASSSFLGRFATLSSTGLVMSLVFFLVTNATVLLAGWYPVSFSGLVSSYVAGLPFFKYTLLGDFCFTSGIFSVYFLTQHVRFSELVGRCVMTIRSAS